MWRHKTQTIATTTTAATATTTAAHNTTQHTFFLKFLISFRFCAVPCIYFSSFTEPPTTTAYITKQLFVSRLRFSSQWVLDGATIMDVNWIVITPNNTKRLSFHFLFRTERRKKHFFFVILFFGHDHRLVFIFVLCLSYFQRSFLLVSFQFNCVWCVKFCFGTFFLSVFFLFWQMRVSTYISSIFAITVLL